MQNFVRGKYDFKLFNQVTFLQNNIFKFDRIDLQFPLASVPLKVLTYP